MLPPDGSILPHADERTVYLPVPLNVTLCLPDESWTSREAESAPVLVGFILTLMTQLVPAARVLPHLLVCEKLAASVPLKVMLVIDSATLPKFESVAV